MKLDQPIEILNQDINHPTAQFMPHLQQAQKLGIDALKAIKKYRQRPNYQFIKELPGEDPQ